MRLKIPEQFIVALLLYVLSLISMAELPDLQTSKKEDSRGRFKSRQVTYLKTFQAVICQLMYNSGCRTFKVYKHCWA